MPKAKNPRNSRRGEDVQADKAIRRMEETYRVFLERMYGLEVERMRLFRLALTKLDRVKLEDLHKKVEDAYPASQKNPRSTPNNP